MKELNFEVITHSNSSFKRFAHVIVFLHTEQYPIELSSFHIIESIFVEVEMEAEKRRIPKFGKWASCSA